MKSVLLPLIITLTIHISLKKAISLGCLHTGECSIDEQCFNDGIFGVCIHENEDIPIPELDVGQLTTIRNEANILNELGYSWEDPFTQCRMTKMVYGTLDNCPSIIDLIESKEEINNGPSFSSFLDRPSAINQIRISLTKSNLLEEIVILLKKILHTEETEGVKIDISADGKSMIISYDPKMMDDPQFEDNLKSLLSDLEDSEMNNNTIKSKITKRETSKSLLNESSPNTRLALKISLFTIIGVVCVAGIIGISLFVYTRRKSDHKETKSTQEKESGRSSKIIKVQNKRLLHNDSESHVEDDDNAVFEVDETITNLNRQSSTSSGAGDPVMMNIDVKTGHLILGYMEEHFKNPDTFDRDWKSIASYEAENSPTYDLSNAKKEIKLKNRSCVHLPYEKCRVKLVESENDFINASFIFDSNPKHPNYIATISPLSSTIEDFWQMVWEQKSVTIVSLDAIEKIARMSDADADACVKFWPHDGTLNLKEFTIHLVSEHRSNLKYVVRSLYLKKKSVNETRTITQFHFHEIPEDEKKLPDVISTFLEFRRKVNKSFRAKMSPVIVHSEDGCGMVGAYILLDMILNRIAKGIRELDIIASLEHLRDQRKGLVNSKEQFKFVTTSIAEEVNELIRSSNE